MADEDYTRLRKQDVKAFDATAVELILEMGEYGWVGRVSRGGHAVMRAPDGETSTSVSRDSLRGRSGRNIRAIFERWKRMQSSDIEPPTTDESDSKPELFTCSVCSATFDSAKKLGGHKRKHSMSTKVCPYCGKDVTYLGSHITRSHGAAFRPDPVEGLLEILSQNENLRKENATYRELYGPLETSYS